ncbi:bifunctional phosphoribosylaminoimidazolecarboxamide formyltransferase/IMP cyclohydrolase [Enterococcus sp. JM9B]|uniref:bifunctional phosphoribosylaminoimidazolecarboxamide formyltransferase/IMP cyclohydrolase n=1 Tax=Enterococcus sp. JM9B TaxID=1857216 RepID=UPI001374AA8D|nr:bifunctional phosphoribosylaminoimidazolecarboxamide formyltransferase/IMP cyclohydrolase [Enterococcus sp. JM9B]KAF1304733.1 bifunctional phosphoribosylaminoimidazolecarboxamide formyltransferase/IMP cyclohydrolase [Enterococcus sp. JM9B]
MKRALISVSDKTGILELAKGLLAAGFEIISTGGTQKVLADANIETITIESVTGFPEMMDGRVKTLHPAIHGGLLARRDLPAHLAAMEAHQISPIDLVVVNLYPFKETIQQPDVTVAEAIEQIDIGGPSMLRSAAKNHASVTVLVDPADYSVVLQELAEEGVTLATRQRLAAKVFRHTAAYDALIAEFLTEKFEKETPEKVTVTYELKQPLRYGENSHQRATFYQSALPVAYSIASGTQLHGKELSYNNIKDADAALRIAREFSEPTVVALKHMNPCGIGRGATIEEAYDFAYEADPISIFGGVVVLNREVDLSIAEKMHRLFLEIILAPSFTPEAFEVLASKKNLRLMTVDFDSTATKETEMVSVLGGVLIQEQDILQEDESQWQVVTKRQPTEAEKQALQFAWKAVKHVKSNAILLANQYQTVGIGAGQMNRVGSMKIAIQQAEENNKLTDAVVASDAFFPMSDSVEFAAQHGIRAIIQPGGSIKDQESIDMANKYNIAMIFTGVRHFRH